MATIYDIAKQVGVSPATVSNAFNRPEQMKPETRERILEAARLLDYRPNISAQALATGKSSIVGLLVSDIRVPYVANVSRGIEDKLVEHGYLPVIASTDGKYEVTGQRLDELRRNGASGFIVVPAFFGISNVTIEKLERLQEQKICSVVAGHEIDTDRINYISIRGQHAAKMITNHLIELGHREIAFISTAYSKGLAVKRWLGFQEALLAASIPLRPELICEDESTPAAGFAAMEKLMALPQPPTAIVAMNDIFARGIIDYVTTHNISVPEQLSFTSFDYLTLAQRTTPKVTSIVVSAYEIGRQSAERFLELQANPDSPPRVDEVPFELVVRETTAPPPSQT